MDSILNIVSLSLAIAAMVPALWPSGRQVRLWTFSAGAICLIVLLSGYRLFVDTRERRAIAQAKNEIISLLRQRKMTFEQINDSSYYRPFEIENLAINELVEEGKVVNNKLEVKDQTGVQYTIRVFSLGH